MSDVTGLQILRFEDAVMGPRKLPVLNDYKQGKVPLERGVFAIDVDTKAVFLTPTGADAAKRIDVGTSLVYVVE